jgi:hypothetical protein
MIRWIPLLCATACSGGTSADGGTPDEPSGPCDPGGTFDLAIDNRFYPLAVGQAHVLEGDEQDGAFGRLEETVLDQTEEVAGVTTRVVQHDSYEDGTLEETALLYYAQAADGSLCQFGEWVPAEDDGWLAGEDDAEAAVFMPADPAVGDVWTFVYVPPDEVESAEVTATGEVFTTPAGTFDDTLTVLEDGPSIKHYAAGIGLIYDDGVELISY